MNGISYSNTLNIEMYVCFLCLFFYKCANLNSRPIISFYIFGNKKKQKQKKQTTKIKKEMKKQKHKNSSKNPWQCVTNRMILKSANKKNKINMNCSVIQIFI